MLIDMLRITIIAKETIKKLVTYRFIKGIRFNYFLSYNTSSKDWKGNKYLLVLQYI
jgi:hypothetical protein